MGLLLLLLDEEGWQLVLRAAVRPTAQSGEFRLCLCVLRMLPVLILLRLCAQLLRVCGRPVVVIAPGRCLLCVPPTGITAAAAALQLVNLLSRWGRHVVQVLALVMLRGMITVFCLGGCVLGAEGGIGSPSTATAVATALALDLLLTLSRGGTLGCAVEGIVALRAHRACLLLA